MSDDEFRFTDSQWREYQQMPEQGYSHRHKLEWFVNSWLTEHDRAVAEKAWDEGWIASNRWNNPKTENDYYQDGGANPFRAPESVSTPKDADA